MPLLKEHVRAGGAWYAAGHRPIPQALGKNCCRVSAKCAAFLKRVVRFICIGKGVVAPCLRARESAEAIADAIRDVDGFGATHAKMLLATLSRAFPEEVSLSDHCPVGKGAKGPLKWMLGGGGGLADFRRLFLSGLPECREGSFLMEKAEQLERAKGWLPDGSWSLLVLQVQPCEFGQFVKFCGKSGVSPGDFQFRSVADVRGRRCGRAGSCERRQRARAQPKRFKWGLAWRTGFGASAAARGTGCACPCRRGR